MEVPQWKKDLIARLRSQNNAVGRHQIQQLYTVTNSSSPQPTTSSFSVGFYTDPDLDQQQQLQQQKQQLQQQSNQKQMPVASIHQCECVVRKCEVPSASINKTKMVQERSWIEYTKHNSYNIDNGICKNGDGKNSDSDSSEDLHYGPGIVNKLKNKYLSLALRESNGRTRASILPMRKAASLENLLDDDNNNTQCNNINSNKLISSKDNNRLFQSKLNGNNDIKRNLPNRYRNSTRGGNDMKRARSVEIITRNENHENSFNTDDTRPKRESLHEDMLIYNNKEGNKLEINDNINKPIENTQTKSYTSNNLNLRINRPKRIAPIMNEKEKPPVDVVKQAKLIFERRPEQRTKAPYHTGEVAAKVATYKNIIVQAKTAKKPPIKNKPVGLGCDKLKLVLKTRNKDDHKLIIQDSTLINESHQKETSTNHIPDISRIDFPKVENDLNVTSSLSQTPDLILTSSPLSTTPFSSFRISINEIFIEEEIRHSTILKNQQTYSICKSPISNDDEIDSPDFKTISPQSIQNISNASTTVTYNFYNNNNNNNNINKISDTNNKNIENSSLINKNVNDYRTPTSQPLKLEINNIDNTEKILSSPIKLLQTTAQELTKIEIEKNLINTAKTLEQNNKNINSISNINNTYNKNKNCDEKGVIKIPVLKVRKLPRESESNSIVFKFTDRKDVPDYVFNDGSRHISKIEKPKIGEGGIILLPGASIDESFTDEDDEIMRSLEAPPSPCDVTFINDNVLIDGKSSLSQKTKKPKMRISFLETCPQIYEYPSESSLLIDDIMLNTSTSSPTSQLSPLSTSSPLTENVIAASVSVSSTLANYTPRTTEEFQPGVTRSIPIKYDKSPENGVEILEEFEEPILFSAGTNTDILF